MPYFGLCRNVSNTETAVPPTALRPAVTNDTLIAALLLRQRDATPFTNPSTFFWTFCYILFVRPSSRTPLNIASYGVCHNPRQPPHKFNRPSTAVYSSLLLQQPRHHQSYLDCWRHRHHHAVIYRYTRKLKLYFFAHCFTCRPVLTASSPLCRSRFSYLYNLCFVTVSHFELFLFQ